MTSYAAGTLTLFFSLVLSGPAIRDALTGRLEPTTAILRLLIALVMSAAAVRVLRSVIDGYHRANQYRAGDSSGGRPGRRKEDETSAQAEVGQGAAHG